MDTARLAVDIIGIFLYNLETYVSFSEIGVSSRKHQVYKRQHGYAALCLHINKQLRLLGGSFPSLLRLMNNGRATVSRGHTWPRLLS